jgi:acetyltransferase-like isoleucine patch superfamily enzyme
MFKIVFSKIIITYLKLLGIKVNFSAEISHFPKLKINGKPENIIIGKVQIVGIIDLRNRENGKIILEDGCKIESDCRIVAAREGSIIIGKKSVITMGAIINGGGNILIGENCILGPRITINANEHKFKKGKLIREQGFIHKDIIIEDDCWFGANTVINKGVVIKSGSVIGASSLVNKSTEKDSINVGIPAKKIAEREN